MGGGKTSAQKKAEAEAAKMRDYAQGIQKEEEAALEQTEQARVLSAEAKNTRRRGMRGVGREGLMHKGSNVGVKRY